MTAHHPGATRPGGWHYRRSLASRVIVLTTMAVGVVVAFVAVGAYLTVRMQLQSTLDSSLMERAKRAASSQALAELTSDCQIPAWATGAADLRIAFITADTRVHTCDQTGPRLEVSRPELAVARGQSASSIRTIWAEGTPYRVVTVPTTLPGQALIVAQSLEPQEDVLRKLGIVMFLFGLAGVIAAGVAGWAVARNGLRPVRRLTAAVEDIARTEELRPLPVEGDDEIARLAAAFNQLLTALGASRDRQRQLVADAGHELRTPLTSLRTNLDLLTQADRDLPDDARAELLGDVRAQIAELTTLIGDLMVLSRDEPLPTVVAPVDFEDVVAQALVRVRRRAPALQFDSVTEPWWVTGDEAALERAVTNLLDNAAKWSPPDGTVTIRLADGVLVVDDEGPGIAEGDLPHVFERFWRAEESRSMPGSGLGLAIVAQVVARHAGSVVAGAAPSGGTRVTMRLPGSATEPDTDTEADTGAGA